MLNLTIRYCNNALNRLIIFDHKDFEYNCFIRLVPNRKKLVSGFESGMLKELKSLIIDSEEKKINFVFDKIKDVVFTISPDELIVDYYDEKQGAINIKEQLNHFFEKEI